MDAAASYCELYLDAPSVGDVVAALVRRGSWVCNGVDLDLAGAWITVVKHKPSTHAEERDDFLSYSVRVEIEPKDETTLTDVAKSVIDGHCVGRGDVAVLEVADTSEDELADRLVVNAVE